MKLIIDIPELDYECAKQRWVKGNDTHQMDYYISKGIPLDDVKAEIEQFAKNPNFGDLSIGASCEEELKFLKCDLENMITGMTICEGILSNEERVHLSLHRRCLSVLERIKVAESEE